MGRLILWSNNLRSASAAAKVPFYTPGAKWGSQGEAINKMVEDGSWEEAVTQNTEGADYQYNRDLNPPTAADGCA